MYYLIILIWFAIFGKLTVKTITKSQTRVIRPPVTLPIFHVEKINNPSDFYNVSEVLNGGGDSMESVYNH